MDHLRDVVAAAGVAVFFETPFILSVLSSTEITELQDVSGIVEIRGGEECVLLKSAAGR